MSIAAGRVRTDNPINPTDGYAIRAESRNSATFFGSDPQLTFLKGVGDAAWYHPLGFGSVFALRLRMGAIWGGASSPTGGKQPPQQERLYAGGASSVRGFQQNELGSLLYVLDDADTVKFNQLGTDTAYFTYPTSLKRSRRVVPVGGNSLFVANVDYRVRSPFLPQLLQFTFFTDVGSVWNWKTQSDFGGFRPYWTPGIGVRVFTPLGPVQVNAGYNPYPPVLGQALYTPGPAKALVGLTGVYCAVPEGTPTAQAPISTRENASAAWKQSPSPQCNQTFRPRLQPGFSHRLTFTFSIGPDF